MNYRLKDVVEVGDSISYAYDFGSTTELILNIHSCRDGEKKDNEIVILSRNISCQSVIRLEWAYVGMPLRYNNDKQKKPLFSRGLSVCRLLFNSFSKLKIDENYKEKRRLFY